MFSPKARFVIMILKQSEALPNVFVKSKICNYDLKTVGSATECFLQKQFWNYVWS